MGTKHIQDGYNQNTCNECGSTNVIDEASRGELTCGDCGLVLETSRISFEKEWRSYNESDEQSKSRVGDPETPLVADKFVSSGLNFNRDASGKLINPQKRWEFYRLANLDRRRNCEIRNLRVALRELQRLTSQLGLGESISQLASIIYRKCLKANLIRGRSINVIIAASLYIACRKDGVPVTLKDIQERANSSPKELSRAIRVLITELNIRPQNSAPNALLQKLGTILKVTMVTQNEALKIISKAKEASITVGKNPMSVAAAALYIAGVRTGERRTQQQLAAAAKTTPVTIRNRFKELMNVLGGFDDIKIKRGAAAIPVIISDPIQFAQEKKKVLSL
jgi:transcription initiation factor TFIIB